MIITDIDKLRNCKTKQISDELLIDHDCFWKNTSEDQFISIPSGSNKFSKYTLTTNDKRKHLEIKITSRSTRTVQQSVFELSENTCLQSLRLYQFDGKKWNLIKEINGLNVDNEYWKEHFYSLENRKIVNL